MARFVSAETVVRRQLSRAIHTLAASDAELIYFNLLISGYSLSKSPVKDNRRVYTFRKERQSKERLLIVIEGPATVPYEDTDLRDLLALLVIEENRCRQMSWGVRRITQALECFVMQQPSSIWHNSKVTVFAIFSGIPFSAQYPKEVESESGEVKMNESNESTNVSETNGLMDKKFDELELSGELKRVLGLVEKNVYKGIRLLNEFFGSQTTTVIADAGHFSLGRTFGEPTPKGVTFRFVGINQRVGNLSIVASRPDDVSGLSAVAYSEFIGRIVLMHRRPDSFDNSEDAVRNRVQELVSAFAALNPEFNIIVAGQFGSVYLKKVEAGVPEVKPAPLTTISRKGVRESVPAALAASVCPNLSGEPKQVSPIPTEELIERKETFAKYYTWFEQANLQYHTRQMHNFVCGLHPVSSNGLVGVITTARLPGGLQLTYSVGDLVVELFWQETDTAEIMQKTDNLRAVAGRVLSLSTENHLFTQCDEVLVNQETLSHIQQAFQKGTLSNGKFYIRMTYASGLTIARAIDDSVVSVGKSLNIQ